MKQINIDKDKQEIEVNIISNITEQLNKLLGLKVQLIDENNIEETRKELIKTESIIEDVHVMGLTNSKNFNRLQFTFTSLNLSLQKYELEQEMEILSKVSEKINKDVIILEEKLKDIQIKQKELENQTEKAEERNNNLVYNLLGFLTAFSSVSAVVGVVAEIKGVINVILFMSFTILLLLTTLIGLHNFYENNNKRENKLQDNYFLWKVVAVIIVVLVVALGIKNINDNKENIFNYLDTKIEKVIEEKVIKEINKEKN